MMISTNQSTVSRWISTNESTLTWYSSVKTMAGSMCSPATVSAPYSVTMTGLPRAFLQFSSSENIFLWMTSVWPGSLYQAKYLGNRVEHCRGH